MKLLTDDRILVRLNIVNSFGVENYLTGLVTFGSNAVVCTVISCTVHLFSFFPHA